MSLSDKEELELRVKALEEALEKVREEAAERQKRRDATLKTLLTEKALVEKRVRELESRASDLESELAVEQDTEKTLAEDARRAEAHRRSLANGGE